MPEALRNDNDLILLGRFGDSNYFAYEIESTEPPQLSAGHALRGSAPAGLDAVAGARRGSWAMRAPWCCGGARHRFCGICGAATLAAEAGMCSSAPIPRAATNNFRASIRPIIVLVERR